MSETKRYQKQREIKAQIENSVRKKSRSRFANSYMSNSKWVRLFGFLSQIEKKPVGIWKLTYNTDDFEAYIPDEEDVSEGYYEFFHGFFELRDIEWLKIEPANLKNALESIKRCGQFYIEKEQKCIKIYGYR